VYGDYGGDWVDEHSELRASRGKGWARLVAEHDWVALHDSFGLPVHVFRCGGIYGGRHSCDWPAAPGCV
jgi:nucleoside-diphosphate-sugar epimerase